MFRALGARLTLDLRGWPELRFSKRRLSESGSGQRVVLRLQTDLLTEGELQENGLKVTVVRCDSGSRSLCRVAVHRPDEWDPSILWLTTVDAVRTGDIVEIGVSVEQDMRHLRVPPSPLAPPLVALLHDFVNKGATAGTQRLRATPELAGRLRTDRLVRAGVSSGPWAAPRGCALQRREGGGRRLPDRCRRPGTHGTRALRACTRLRHAARRGFASTHQATRHALGVRRCGAHLLAAAPADRSAATSPVAFPPAAQHGERAGHHSSRGRGGRPLIPPPGWHRDPACNSLARARAGAHRGDQRPIPTRPVRHRCCATSCSESSTPRWRSSTRWRRCSINSCSRRRAADEKPRLAGLRTRADAPTELTGKPAPPSRRVAASEPGDPASRD